MLVVFCRSAGFLPPHVHYGLHVLPLFIVDLFQFNATANFTAFSKKS